MANVAAKIHIEGIVQGVGFRHFTYRKSQECDIQGFVRNLRDGRVQVHAEGEQKCMDRFLAELRQGPVGSRIRGFYVNQVPYTGKYNEFSVLLDL
ncbi:MAG: acylphosphatase [Candidatus Coatesbacteria bacterium]|nr:acylphosphatase [Candidatus Coatesbacteria bacterium]